MPSGVGALTNSLSFLDLGGIREESADFNRNIFGQPCQQDQFLDASAGIELIACLLFTLYLFIFKGARALCNCHDLTGLSRRLQCGAFWKQVMGCVNMLSMR